MCGGCRTAGRGRKGGQEGNRTIGGKCVGFDPGERYGTVGVWKREGTYFRYCGGRRLEGMELLVLGHISE